MSLLCLLLLLLPTHSLGAPVVQTSLGAVRGVSTQSLTSEFLGIPYAKAPRFAPPLSLQSTPFPGGVFNATAFGPCCPQLSTSSFIPATDEQCLSLNIFAPAELPDHPIPVMLWLHGGGAQYGCSAQSIPALYNGSNIVSHAPNNTPVIVVTMNYRLGVLANLYLEGAALEDPAWPTSGNYLILDIQTCIRWLHAHISSFGGDPTRITTFGQSAGGNLGISLGAATGSSGLYAGHISQSGTAAIAAGWFNLSAALAASSALVHASPCDPLQSPAAQLACLRGLTVDQLLQAAQNLSTSSVVDGVLFKDYEYTSMRKGTYANVSLLIGANDPDNFAACAYAPSANSAQALAYAAETMAEWGVPASSVPVALQLYNISTCTAAAGANQCCRAVELLMLDYAMVCNARRILNATWSATPPHVNKYWYTLHCTPKCPTSPPGICQHTSELEYVFGTVSNYESAAAPKCSWPAPVRAFSDSLIASWTAFATSGDPNVGSAVPRAYWPAFVPVGVRGDAMYLLDENGPFQALSFAQNSLCDFWDELELSMDAELLG